MRLLYADRDAPGSLSGTSRNPADLSLTEKTWTIPVHDHTRSAQKFNLFAEASCQHKRDLMGDPLQVIARHIDFGGLAQLVDTHIAARASRRRVVLSP